MRSECASENQRSHAHGGDQRSRAPSQKLQVDHMSVAKSHDLEEIHFPQASHGAERSSLQSEAVGAKSTNPK